MKKIVLLAFVLMLLSTAMVVGFIRPAVGEGTIYIRADGSIEGTTDISTVDNVTYTLTDNIVNQSVVVERSNIIIDGNGYTLQGSGSGDGFYLSDINNVTVTQTNIKGFQPLWLGITVLRSFNISICGNNITNNSHYGIGLFSSHNNNIYDNDITDNYRGIGLYSSNNNFVVGNNFENNVYGIRLGSSSDNIFYHNNFINNEAQVYDEDIPKSINVWDDGYPSGGNYWSDYNGTDTDLNGIGDTAYEIDATNQDNHPLMGMFSDFPITLEDETFHFTTICNFTISEFEFDQVNRIVRFNVTGEEGIGFCRVCVSNDFIEPPYTVTVGGQSPIKPVGIINSPPYMWIYFRFQAGEHEIVIVPEFPTWTPILLMLIVLTVVIAIYMRARRTVI